MSLEETLCKHGVNVACYCYDCKWELKEQQMARDIHDNILRCVHGKQFSECRQCNVPPANVLYVPKDFPKDTTELQAQLDKIDAEAAKGRKTLREDFIKLQGWTQVVHNKTLFWHKFVWPYNEDKHEVDTSGFRLLLTAVSVQDCIDIEMQLDIKHRDYIKHKLGQKDMADSGSFIGEAS